MKRYFFSIILLSTFICGKAQTFSPDCLQYEVLTANTVRLTGCLAQEGIAIIPQTVELSGQTYTVTEIGNEVFKDKAFSAISMPGTITTIGTNAFSNCQATFIRMSPAVTKLEDGAFQGCQAIGHIDLPQSLTTIGNNAFSNTSVYTVGTEELPNLTDLGEAAFSGCDMLLATPQIDNVENLGEDAFAGCASLQTTYLPEDMTEIPDGLYKGCNNLQHISLPQDLKSIGAYAFMDSGIKNIDLSNYNGKIGVMAFNGCQNLEQLALSADNPYYRTSNNGKVLCLKSTRELVSVLPNAERLSIEYGTRGEYVLDSLNNDIAYPLSGNFPKLTSLELPYTWTGRIEGFFPALQDMTIRSSQPFLNLMMYEEMPQVYVFPHAHDAFVKPDQNLFGSIWSEFDLNGLYRDLKLPISRMYMQEVKDMYANANTSLQGNRLFVWETDWNKELQEKHPEYFTDVLIGNMGSTSKPVTPLDYRYNMIQQYMSTEKMRAYGWQPDSILYCLDGDVRFMSGFDVNDYVNWYLSSKLIPADQYCTFLNNTGTITSIDSGDIPSYLIETANAAGNPSFNYAIPMLPSTDYNIYVVMAPHNPIRVMVGEEEVEPKNKISCTLSYNDASEGGRPASQQSGIVEVEYNGEPQEVLVFENIKVERDYFNVLKISTKTTSSERRNGYSNSLAIIGVIARPATPVDPLPSDISSIEQQKKTESYYDLQGRRRSQLMHGVNIIRFSDGTTKKLMTK